MCTKHTAVLMTAVQGELVHTSIKNGPNAEASLPLYARLDSLPPHSSFQAISPFFSLHFLSHWFLLLLFIWVYFICIVLYSFFFFLSRDFLEP